MATNPYVNKVQYGNQTVMDITDTTASEGDVANGEVFYKGSGERATGTALVAEIPLLPIHGGTGNVNGRVQVGQVSGTAVGEYATSEGLNTNASGANSHAEGSSTTASSTCAHAEGMATTASNYYAHAEGANNTASGISSHVEGQNNTASGGCSHAGGFHTTAAYNDQTAIGTYNDNKSTTLFEVGNGTSNSASNAFEVYSDGHVNAQGAYYQGGVNKSAIWDNAQAGALDAIDSTVGWTGKNLLKNHATSGTSNGVTYTINANGTVSLSGTATSDVYITLFRTTLHSEIIPQGTYRLTGCPEGGTNAYMLYVDQSGSSAFDFGGGANWTNNNADYAVAIKVFNGTNVTGKIFYPMIRPATITDGTFEPYHDSVEDWYWDINAEIGVHQLFDYNKWKSNILISGGTGVFQNNGVTLTATSADCFTAYANNWGNFSPISVQEGQSFNLSWGFSGTGSSSEDVYVFNYTSGSVIAKTGATSGSLTFTIPSGVTQISFRVGIHTSGSVGNYTNILLKRADDTNTDYTSYAMTNKELTDSKDTWTAESTVANGSVTFTGLDDTHGWGYEPYAWIDGNTTELDPYFKLTTISGAGTSNMTVIYSTNADSGSRVKLRISK